MTTTTPKTKKAPKTTAKAKAPTTTSTYIKRSYLMWVGKEHYLTVESYVDEVTKMGVSKRMPTAAMAQSLAQPGTVVFLAHDEGMYMECPKCTDAVPCWGGCEGTGKLNAGTVLEEACAKCGGTGEFTGGTGGTVSVDGKFNLPWIAHWRAKMYDKAYREAAHVVVDECMCKDCGGKGTIPQGMVFGCFVPSAIEYIVPTGASDAVREEAAKRGFKMVEEVLVEAEARRGCGKRKAGGVYVVTKDAALDPKVANGLLEELIAAGRVTDAGANVHGAFLQFIEPIAIAQKRFRGLKLMDLTPEVAASAEMMVEAAA